MITWSPGKVRVNRRRTPFTESHLVGMAWEEISIRGNVCGRDMFKCLSRNSEEWDALLQEHYLHDHIRNFKRIEKLEKNGRIKADSRWISTINFGWSSEIIGDTFQFRLDTFGKKRGSPIARGLSLTSTEDLLNATIKVDPSVNVSNWNNGDPETLYWGKKYPTVLNLFKTFIHEISFHPPQDIRNVRTGT